LAVVRLNGQDIYLGKHDTPESRGLYDRTIGEWLANGRRLPRAAPGDVPPHTAGPSVVELVVVYWNHVQAYYRRADGSPTSEIPALRAAFRPLRRLYGELPAAEFGPLKLKALRERMIDARWARSTINHHVQRIVRMFKWGVGCEMIPPTVHQALAAVEGLRAGRSAAKEPPPVAPVPEAAIAAVLPLVCPTVAAMIRLQRLTGMRSGEVCIMRRRDLDTSGQVWIYRPPTHKNAHRGHQRIIPIGPHAQRILEPLLTTSLEAFVFSPAAEAAQQQESSRRPRKSRRRGAERQRGPGDRYTVDSYRRAIARACDDAFSLPRALQADLERLEKWKRDAWKLNKRPARLDEMPTEIRAARARIEAFRAPLRWHPHQLRHNAATDLRAQFGIEVARVVLGHRNLSTTEIYAEQNIAKATEAMRLVG
jgi:integrase